MKETWGANSEQRLHPGGGEELSRGLCCRSCLATRGSHLDDAMAYLENPTNHLNQFVIKKMSSAKSQNIRNKQEQRHNFQHPIAEWKLRAFFSEIVKNSRLWQQSIRPSPGPLCKQDPVLLHGLKCPWSQSLIKTYIGRAGQTQGDIYRNVTVDLRTKGVWQSLWTNRRETV